MRFLASKSRSAKGKPDAKRGGKGAPRTKPGPASPALSNDQIIDIIGVVLLAVSIVTVLSWLSNQRGELTGTWIATLSQAFGWGAVVAPLLMFAVGLYMVLRRFGDRFPRPASSRVAGIFLAYVGSLALFHAIALAASATADVAPGSGGGAVGRVIFDGLSGLIGPVGAVIALLVVLIIAVMLSAARSMSQLIEAVRSRAAGLRTAAGPRARGDVILPPWDEPLDDDIPINGLARSRRRNGNAEPAEDKIAVPVAPPPAVPRVNRSGGASAANAAQARAGDGRMPPPRVIGQPDPHAPPKVTVSPAPAPSQAKEPAGPPGITSRYEGKQAWALPAIDQMLEPGMDASLKEEDMRKRARVIEETLKSFGVPAKVVEINCGPTITQYGVEPGFVEMKNGKQQKVKVSRIAALSDDIALALEAPRIRIEAPVPGKGFVGIEVPNGATALVSLRDVMETEPFGKVQSKSRLPLALGQDVSGGPVVADLTSMPHLLIAGTTGSGKSVCVNGIITTLLMLNAPQDLRLIMVDPKRVELTGYNGLPHLLAPVVVEVEKVTTVLHWVTREMDNRYRTFAKFGARNIVDFNQKAEEAEARRKQNEQRMQASPDVVVKQSGDDELRKLPYIVVVIDELADLMMLAPDETEKTICRLAQMARATGIHLIIATQRPSVDVVTGLIKANFPARIAFTVATSIDSRVILDQPGAEKLLGRGDMLFVAPDSGSPMRAQGCFLSDKEIQKVVRHWRGQYGSVPHPAPDPISAGMTGPDTPVVGTLDDEAPPPAGQLTWDEMRALDQAAKDSTKDRADTMFDQAVETVRLQGKASISLLQRRLRIGYTRAARLIEEMEEQGIVGPQVPGSQFREVLPPRAP